MCEYPTAAPEYRDPYDHDFPHAACLHQPHAPRENVDALRKLARNILDPDMYGFSVTPEVRDAAREALGLKPCEYRVKEPSEMKWFTQAEIDTMLAKAREATMAEAFAATVVGPSECILRTAGAQKTQKLYTQDEVDAIIARQSGK